MIKNICYLILLTFAFVACDEDTPIIDNNGVNKRLKSFTVTANAQWASGEHKVGFEYQNERISQIVEYEVVGGISEDSSMVELNYVGNTIELLLEGVEKNIYEIDNNNIVRELVYAYENGEYELEPYQEVVYSYLSTGQFESYTWEPDNGTYFDDLGRSYLGLLEAEFDASNILNNWQYTEYPNSGNELTGQFDFTHDGTNVISALSTNVVDFLSNEYDTIFTSIKYIYDESNQLIHENRKEWDTDSPDVRTVDMSFSYDSDGLLKSVSSINENNETFEVEYTYEQGKGNAQLFWELITQFYFEGYDVLADITSVTSIDGYTHKMINKGIATIQ